MDGIITPAIARETASAMRSLGADAFLFEDFNTFDELHNAVAALKPDFAFTINYLASRQHLPFFKQFNVPHATWFVDAPINIFHANEVNADDLFFATDETWLEHLRRAGAINTHHLPLCTNPNIFKPSANDRELAPYRNDISFLGSTMRSGGFDTALDSLDLTEQSRFVFDKIIRERVKNPGAPFEKIVQDTAPELSAILSNPAALAIKIMLLDKAGQDIRAKYVSSLGTFAHVYGDDAWLDLAHTGLHVHPGLDPINQAPLLYQASRINLNFTSGQLETGINQRIFDVPAAGGFILTDYRPDLERLFDFKNEIACFHSLPEMKEQIEYFLTHEEERTAISQKARARVLAEHTYQHRAETILNTIISTFKT